MAREPFIRPDVRAFLDAMNAAPRPPFTDALIAQIRQIPPGTMASPDLPVGDLAVVSEIAMPGPACDLALTLFDPRPTRAPGPVVVFFHGGGFVVGSTETHGGLCASIARGLDLPVVSVDYRLAPEHKWPAAPDDAEAAVRWIAENGAAFDRSFTHLVLCGDSAGGTLAIVTALALRDRPAALPLILQWLIYPGADATVSYPSAETFAEGFGLPGADMAYYMDAYAPDRQHWRHSPILADQSGLPVTFVVTAGLDPLRDQGRAYATSVIAAGGEVIYREAAGTIHGFATYRRGIPSARDDVEAMIATARQTIAGILA